AQGHLLRPTAAAPVPDRAALQHGNPAATGAAAEDPAEHRGPGPPAVPGAGPVDHRQAVPGALDARAHEPAEPGHAGQVAARTAAAPGAHDPRPARAHVAAAPERSTGALAAPRSLGRAPDRRGAAGGRLTAGHRQRWQPEQPGNLAHLADGDHRPLSRHPPIASSAAGVAHWAPYHSPSADCESCSEDAMNDWQEEINWNADGLVPAIAQDHQTGRILMMAWMNRESLRLSVEEGRAIYWSRSRGKLWRKGEESGH